MAWDARKVKRAGYSIFPAGSSAPRSRQACFDRKGGLTRLDSKKWVASATWASNF